MSQLCFYSTLASDGTQMLAWNGTFQNPCIKAAVVHITFQDRCSITAQAPSAFYPIPILTIAFACVAVCICSLTLLHSIYIHMQYQVQYALKTVAHDHEHKLEAPTGNVDFSWFVATIVTYASDHPVEFNALRRGCGRLGGEYFFFLATDSLLNSQ